MKPGQRAGLVGTNTIRQNYSRESGLDYIVNNGGVIADAVSSMLWPGEANLHVSIVNWIKGTAEGKKRLSMQIGTVPDEGWSNIELDRIPSSLSFKLDVTKAQSLSANEKGGCYQGQTHGHDGFLLSDPSSAKALIKKEPRYADVVYPFLIGDDLIGELNSKPSRYVIDFNPLDLLDAKSYPAVFAQVKAKVLPARKAAAKEEEERNEPVLKRNPEAHVNRHHANFLRRWWIMSYPRSEMVEAISKKKRYLACGQVTKRPIFDFVSAKIRPNAMITVFAHDDDYSFGILQSGIHWLWFIERCSTLTERPRYTSNTVFDSFPWPQTPTAKAARKVADLGIKFREVRSSLRSKHKISYRELYQSLEGPGDNPLKKAQAHLDAAVRSAYNMPADADPLAFLLELNLKLAKLEEDGKEIVGPGLPAIINDKASFVTADCIKP